MTIQHLHGKWARNNPKNNGGRRVGDIFPSPSYRYAEMPLHASFEWLNIMEEAKTSIGRPLNVQAVTTRLPSSLGMGRDGSPSRTWLRP